MGVQVPPSTPAFSYQRAVVLLRHGLAEFAAKGAFVLSVGAGVALRAPWARRVPGQVSNAVCGCCITGNAPAGDAGLSRADLFGATGRLRERLAAVQVGSRTLWTSAWRHSVSGAVRSARRFSYRPLATRPFKRSRQRNYITAPERAFGACASRRAIPRTFVTEPMTRWNRATGVPQYGPDFRGAPPS